MRARLWLVLLSVLALAAPASSAGAQSGAPRGSTVEPPRASTVEAPQSGPTIGADESPYSASVRAAETAEMLTVVVRVVVVGHALPSGTAGCAGAAFAPRSLRPAGWCDVVQCRRWAGAQLLRYATPPPSRH